MKIELNKSLRERVFHAVLFEVFGNLVIAISLAYLLKIEIIQSGKLSIISALTATVWNYVINKVFDELQRHLFFERTFFVRILHAVIFEAVLVISLTPVAMFLLRLSITKALLVEISLICVFLPYTLAFNWAYDYVRWTFLTDH